MPGKKMSSPLSWARVKGPVATTDSPTREEFAAREGRPVIITGSVNRSRALSRWTPTYLKSTVGSRRIDVYVSADGTFPGGSGPYDHNKHRNVEMTVSECIDRMNGLKLNPVITPGEKYYLYQSPAEHFQDILGDLHDPPYLPEGPGPDRGFIQNVWMSGAGNVTPIHYDLSENILVQILGEKRVLLWDPSQYSLLYLNPLGTQHDRQSRIDVNRPDATSFPRFVNAKALEYILRPGEMLYIPAFWMHYVYTIRFSVSVNYWWASPQLAHFISGMQKILMSSQRLEDALLETKRCASETVGVSRPELLVLLQNMFADGSMANLRAMLTSQVAAGEGGPGGPPRARHGG
jgi:Cupin-like domain